MTRVKSWRPTFKDLAAFEKRLKDGICWGDWIMVAGLTYKMVEYGGGYGSDYMLFQNKKTMRMIEVRYQCPTSRYENGEKVEGKPYEFYSVDEMEMDYLHRNV